MKRKKRITIRIVLAFLLFPVLFIVFNRFDTAPPHGGFTLEDLHPVDLEPGNGYYFIVSLFEDPGMDTASRESMQFFRKLVDPRFAGKERLTAFARGRDRRAELLSGRLAGILGPKGIHRLDYFETGDTGWAGKIIPAREELRLARELLKDILPRYRRFLACEKIDDFTPVATGGPYTFAGEPWCRVGKVYTALSMLDALEGNWRIGVADLLDQVNALRKFVAGSRGIRGHILGLNVMGHALYALAELMSREECPGEVFDMVYRGLSPLEYGKFNGGNTFIFEYLSASRFLDNPAMQMANYHPLLGLFLQKNRTRGYFYDFYSRLIRYDKMPPYRWDSTDPFAMAEKNSPCWWVRNGYGKRIFRDKVKDVPAGFFREKFLVKTFYDMVRISAELHLEFDTGKSVAENLSSLESYRTPDPFTGKPYLWYEYKQVLYSVGENRVDNGGVAFSRENGLGDYLIPCIIFIKPQ